MRDVSRGWFRTRAVDLLCPKRIVVCYIPPELFNDGRGSLENNLAFPRYPVAFGHFTSVVVKDDHPWILQ